jgi:hypothetical protein
MQGSNHSLEAVCPDSTSLVFLNPSELYFLSETTGGGALKPEGRGRDRLSLLTEMSTRNLAGE